MLINTIFKGRIKHIHFVGIGGIGMSGIAKVLIGSGFKISGSDLKDGPQTRSLKTLGAKIFLGHHEKNSEGADVLVFSSAVDQNNPEIINAKKNNIPIIPRAVMLAEIMRLRCGIAIAGSHGKTTTTSLVGTLMNKMGLDPTVVIGGVVNNFKSNAILGNSQYMVTEADESDGTFLHLAPSIAVVTNIDAEHLDFYLGGIDEIKNNFAQFLSSVPFYGLVVGCIDDPNVKEILAKLNRRIKTYGFDENANYCAKNISFAGEQSTFDLYIDQIFYHRFETNLAGRHNILNALAAMAVLDELGICVKNLCDELKNFGGVNRRFTKVASHENFCIIDDYAHHPTEIRAVLDAARTTFEGKTLRVLFQPHRYSRTKDLMEEFSKCFNNCDSLVITEIFPASESPIEGISSEVLIEKIHSQCDLSVLHAKDLNEGAQKITDLCQKNDVVLTLGAGSITQAGPQIFSLWQKKFGVNP